MNIFSHLTDFGYQRNWKEAIGFYLAYLVLTMLVGGLLAGVTSTFFVPETDSFEQGFDFGVKVGTFVAVVITLLLGGVILKKKNLLHGFGYILLLLVSGILAFFAGEPDPGCVSDHKTWRPIERSESTYSPLKPAHGVYARLGASIQNSPSSFFLILLASVVPMGSLLLNLRCDTARRISVLLMPPPRNMESSPRTYDLSLPSRTRKPRSALSTRFMVTVLPMGQP